MSDGRPSHGYRFELRTEALDTVHTDPNSRQLLQQSLRGSDNGGGYDKGGYLINCGAIVILGIPPPKYGVIMIGRVKIC